MEGIAWGVSRIWGRGSMFPEDSPSLPPRGLLPPGRPHPREAEQWSRMGWLKMRFAQLTAPRSVLRPMNQETAKVIQTAFQRASCPDIKGERAMMLLGCIKYGLHTC